MSFRFVVRPRHIRSTPRQLKEALGAQRLLPWPSPACRQAPTSQRLPHWKEDFFLAYPETRFIGDWQQLNETDRRAYSLCRGLVRATKAQQRSILRADGIPVPATFTERNSAEDIQSARFVVRPLRHSQGRNYRLTTNKNDFIEGEEYISELYEKNHEYRVITCFGVPIITLYKQVPENVPRDGPWNHSNGSTFVTVRDWNNNRLRHTDLFDRLSASPTIQALHLCGVDVLYKQRNEYVVCEVNVCPSITIPDNLRKVAEHALSRQD